ncbi:TPA: hypothetical protein LA742_001711 [Clostridium botulinum]|nr:hypothetical protein [Clostridium botulinum]
MQAYDDPFIGNIEIVNYSYDGFYPRIISTKPRQDFYDVFYDASKSKKGNVYIRVIQQDSGGNRNLVVDIMTIIILLMQNILIYLQIY